MPIVNDQMDTERVVVQIYETLYDLLGSRVSVATAKELSEALDLPIFKVNRALNHASQRSSPFIEIATEGGRTGYRYIGLPPPGRAPSNASGPAVGDALRPAPVVLSGERPHRHRARAKRTDRTLAVLDARIHAAIGASGACAMEMVARTIGGYVIGAGKIGRARVRARMLELIELGELIEFEHSARNTLIKRARRTKIPQLVLCNTNGLAYEFKARRRRFDPDTPDSSLGFYFSATGNLLEPPANRAVRAKLDGNWDTAMLRASSTLMIAQMSEWSVEAAIEGLPLHVFKADKRAFADTAARPRRAQMLRNWLIDKGFDSIGFYNEARVLHVAVLSSQQIIPIRRR